LRRPCFAALMKVGFLVNFLICSFVGYSKR
jgi:hypothetical protein